MGGARIDAGRLCSDKPTSLFFTRSQFRVSTQTMACNTPLRAPCSGSGALNTPPRPKKARKGDPPARGINPPLRCDFLLAKIALAREQRILDPPRVACVNGCVCVAQTRASCSRRLLCLARVQNYDLLIRRTGFAAAVHHTHLFAVLFSCTFVAGFHHIVGLSPSCNGSCTDCSLSLGFPAPHNSRCFLIQLQS